MNFDRLLLSGRRVGSTRRCDQSACSEAVNGGTFTYFEKCLCVRWGQQGRCPLADRAQALAVPGRLKQQFVPYENSSQKSRLCKTN